MMTQKKDRHYQIFEPTTATKIGCQRGEIAILREGLNDCQLTVRLSQNPFQGVVLPVKSPRIRSCIFRSGCVHHDCSSNHDDPAKAFEASSRHVVQAKLDCSETD